MTKLEDGIVKVCLQWLNEVYGDYYNEKEDRQQLQSLVKAIASGLKIDEEKVTEILAYRAYTNVSIFDLALAKSIAEADVITFKEGESE